MVNGTENINVPVQSYSGGMKRRLSVALALRHRPPILILDEPTVGIDPVLRKGIWAEFFALVEQGTSIILTTHVMDEVAKCHQLAMMREGRFIAQGTPQQLQDRAGAATIEESFIHFGVGKDAD